MLTEPGSTRPIRLLAPPALLPDADTMAELERLAGAPGLTHHVAALPDLHWKSRNLGPTGTVVVTRNAIVPGAVDYGVGCGIRVILSDIDVRSLTPRALDSLFRELVRAVPVKEHDQPVLAAAEIRTVLTQGGRWGQEAFGLSDAELDRIEDRGAVRADGDDPEALLASIPEKALDKGRRRFATLGAGNHFIEVQEIAEVLDGDLAGRLGLTRGRTIFMLHTGSRGLGNKVLRSYADALEQRAAPGRRGSHPSMPADSEEGLRYARAAAAAANFAFANRIAITERLRSVVRHVLGDRALELPLLYDCSHVSIKRERWNGEPLWVHRHGASRALPPSQMGDHPIFSATGQPVPIPGSMGDTSFIGVAGEGCAEAFFSVNHGAGRVMDKPEAAARFSDQQVERELRAKRIRLYRYGVDNIAEQAPGSFKDISRVVEAMAALELARPVARLRPVAVLKG